MRFMTPPPFLHCTIPPYFCKYGILRGFGSPEDSYCPGSLDSDFFMCYTLNRMRVLFRLKILFRLELSLWRELRPSRPETSLRAPSPAAAASARLPASLLARPPAVLLTSSARRSKFLYYLVTDKTGNTSCITCFLSWRKYGTSV